MSKTEFLEELARHLHVLEDSELQDILAEYAQHIDMKMQGGLSEEAAIRDFGPIRELAADILTAYHVRPDFSPEEEERGHVFYVKAPDMSKLKESGKQAADAMGRQAGRFGAWFRGVCAAIAAAFQKLFQKLKGAGREDFSAGDSFATPHAHSKSTGFRRACAAGGRGISRFFRWLGRVIVTLVRWAWNACWAVVSAVLAFFALAFLFAFGLLVVWVVRGYPFVGLTMGSLGLSLALGALACLTWTVINTKRRSAVDAAWSTPRDQAPQDPWEEEEEDWEEAPPEENWPEEMLPAPESGEEETAREDDHQEGGSRHA